MVPEQEETAARGDAAINRQRCGIDQQRAQQSQREWCGARWPQGREHSPLRLQQVMYRESDGYGAEEQAAKWRRHLPKRANSSVGSEEGGGLAEAARRLPRIGRYGGELADGTVRRIAQCGEPMGHRPHMWRFAPRHRSVRNRHLFPPRSSWRLIAVRRPEGDSPLWVPWPRCEPSRRSIGLHELPCPSSSTVLST